MTNPQPKSLEEYFENICRAQKFYEMTGSWAERNQLKNIIHEAARIYMPEMRWVK